MGAIDLSGHDGDRVLESQALLSLDPTEAAVDLA